MVHPFRDIQGRGSQSRSCKDVNTMALSTSVPILVLLKESEPNRPFSALTSLTMVLASAFQVFKPKFWVKREYVMQVKHKICLLQKRSYYMTTWTSNRTPFIIENNKVLIVLVKCNSTNQRWRPTFSVPCASLIT